MNRSMLKQQAKYNFRFSMTLILLWIFTFYASSCIAYSLQIKMASLDFYLYILTDPYIMVYGVFTVALFTVAKISFENHSIVVMRFGSFFKYWCFRVVNCLIYLLLLIIAIVSILSILSFLFIAPKLGFLSADITNVLEYENVISLYYAKIGNNLVGVFLAIIYWMLGMTFFSVLLNFIQIIFSKKIYIFCCIVLYLFTAVGVSKPVDNVFLSLLLPTNYFILGYPLSLNTVYIHLILMISVSTILVLLIRHRAANIIRNIQ